MKTAHLFLNSFTRILVQLKKKKLLFIKTILTFYVCTQFPH